MRLSIVGAGNVASHLARAFSRAGADIVQIAARTDESARRLADEVGAGVADVAHMDADVDFIIISVSDKAVVEVASQLPVGRAVVAHTSGSILLEDVEAAAHRPASVLYPLQTFSRDVAVDISEVPFFTEATDEATLARVDSLASMLSSHVYHADSSQRRALHIAGVLTSNFTVHLLEISRRVLAGAGFPLQVVEPLAKATLAKAFAVGPAKAMTGPAHRGDVAVTRLQAAALEGDDRAIYEAITNAILNSNK